MTPSLAAPLSKALTPDLAFTFFEDELADASWIDEADAIDLLLSRLRADPDVLAAMAEALHNIVGYDPLHERCNEYAAAILDALFGTLGAGPISSGEAAE